MNPASGDSTDGHNVDEETKVEDAEGNLENKMILGEMYEHKWLDVLDQYSKWYEAQIKAVRVNTQGDTEIKVHYMGFATKFDEWINATRATNRLAPLNTKVKPPLAAVNPGTLKKAMLLDVRDASKKWYMGEVMEVNHKRGLAKIHYDGWPSKYDEWIDMHSYRLAPLETHQKKTKRSPLKPAAAPQKQPAPIAAAPSRGRRVLAARSLNRTASSKNSNKSGESATKRLRRQTSSQSATSDQEAQFRNELARKDLYIKEQGGDGNCLFRSISHQIYGTPDHHMVVRQKCMDYIEAEHVYFKPYIAHDSEEDFKEYIEHYRRSGVWGGNVEIQAMSEVYQRPVEIYAYSASPRKTYSDQAENRTNRPPIRLSYHFSSHYNSIIGNSHHQHVETSAPGRLEDNRIQMSLLRSTMAQRATLQLSDLQATEQAELDTILALSRNQFEQGRLGNSEFDGTIAESMRAWADEKERREKEMFKEAIAQSLADSNVIMDDQTAVEAVNEAAFQNEMQAAILTSMGGTQNAAALVGDMPLPVSLLMHEGYDLADAFAVYTVYHKPGIPTEQVTANMRSHLMQNATFNYPNE